MRRKDRAERGTSERGYTLIELLIVVAIVGMLVLVTVPNFMTMMRSGRMKSALRQFTGDIRGMRQRSITQNFPTKITFTTGGYGTRTYRMFDGTLNPGTGVITWKIVPVRTKQLDDSVYFTSTTLTDEDSDSLFDVIFRSNGTVVNVPAGTNFGVVRIKTDNAIPRPQYNIELYTTGRIQVD